MLDLDHATEDITQLWPQLESAVELPDDWEEFLERTGPVPSLPDCRRSFQRFFLRHQGILSRRDEQHGVYFKDVSRTGIALLSPIQLFPQERFEVWMFPARYRLQLQLVRCRRLHAGCYECGTRIVGEEAE